MGPLNATILTKSYPLVHWTPSRWCLGTLPTPPPTPHPHTQNHLIGWPTEKQSPNTHYNDILQAPNWHSFYCVFSLYEYSLCHTIINNPNLWGQDTCGLWPLNLWLTPMYEYCCKTQISLKLMLINHQKLKSPNWGLDVFKCRCWYASCDDDEQGFLSYR